MRRIIFIKRLTDEELGQNETNEKYICLPNDFDYEAFFQNEGQLNNSVKIDFNAQAKNDGENLSLTFISNNEEKRIPILEQVFATYNANENNIVYLESITEGGKTRINISFLNSSEIKLYTSPISYGIDDDSKDNEVVTPQIKGLPLQQIFYGAPGTGKSHAIKERTEGMDVIRTTFHPDTDYATFVGAYKPTTKSLPMTTVIGTKAVAVEDKDGNEVTEDKIVYEFVPQAFLQSYVAAWRKLDKAEDLSEALQEYLVIEEINRGNCAQIFGDLFQLLDRGDGGFSEYPIKADADMKKYLQRALKGIDLDGIEYALNAMFKGKEIARQVKEGDILLLPCNLCIWATMNTSDQSLFPIDSAFKRRWDWQYVPISDAGKNWVIRVNGNDYSWWNFLEEINNRIYKATYSEDKKLGYFFCKAKDGVIDADMFVGKVVFYLWNDVFKDMEFEGDAFKDGDNGKLSFDKFYMVEGNKTKVVSNKVEVFLKNLGLEPIAIIEEEDAVDTEEIKVENGKNTRGVNKGIKAFYNGTLYEGKGADVLERLVKTIGIERIRNIQNDEHKIAGKYLIVDDNMRRTIENLERIYGRGLDAHNLGDGYYLFTYSDTLSKVAQLNEIKDKLDIDLNIEIS